MCMSTKIEAWTMQKQSERELESKSDKCSMSKRYVADIEQKRQIGLIDRQVP